MKLKKISSNGAIVFWTPQDTPRQPLVDKLRELQVRLPGMRTPAGALKAAIGDYTEHKNTRDRGSLVVANKRPSTNGLSTFQTEREEERSHVTYDFTAKVDEDGMVGVTGGYANRDYLQKFYDKHMAILPGAMVGATLVGIIRDMDGVTVKDTGGVYWLDETQLELWAKVADAVESVSGTCITSVAHAVDEQMARALKRGLAKEVEKGVNDLLDEIADGMGDDALNARKEKAGHLHERIDAFASILGDVQDMLHDKVKVVEELVTRLTLATVGV